MPRPRRIDQTLVAQAQKVVATATDVHQIRAAQAILLPALLGASLEKTATLLGVGRATVPRLQAQFGTQVSGKPIPRKSWGGRRHALLSVAEEKEFVSNFAGPWKGAKITINVGSVQPVTADIAVNEGSYEVSGLSTPDGKPAPPVMGKYLNTIVKKNGAWVLASHAAVAPQPPPTK